MFLIRSRGFATAASKTGLANECGSPAAAGDDIQNQQPRPHGRRQGAAAG